MSTWMSSIKDVHDREPKLPSWSRKSLFVKSKPSEEWHQQIDFTAGGHRPSEQKFQWDLVKRHTDYYIKKKGKITRAEIDVKLASLIEQHEARDVAISACAHAMSPKAVRAILNVELNVAPTTFFGLEMYLQSLIAANHCSPTSVTELEARWARELLPYAEHGTSAAGRYLEGICAMLRTTDTPNMNALSDFSILARRAFNTFATQLEGMRLRCQWISAYNAAAWMTKMAQSTPAVTPHGNLMSEHLMDIQFPVWRIWARWKPDTSFIARLESVDAMKKAVLVDMMALEGPDFINGTQKTLKDGLIKQYTAGKPLVRFRSLVLEVEQGTREELRDILHKTRALLHRALSGGDGLFKSFVKLAITKPITREGLQLLEAVGKFQDTPTFPVYNATLEIYTARNNIGGGHITALKHLICAIDDVRGEELRKVMLRPWLVQGIEKCIKQCQAAVRMHINTGITWTHLVLEFHAFLSIVKGSQNCLLLLDLEIQRQLSALPPLETMETLLEIYAAVADEKIKDDSSSTDVLKIAIAAWFIDRLLEQGTLSHDLRDIVESIIHVWNETTTKANVNLERRSLALLSSRYAGADFRLRIHCFNQIVHLSSDCVTGLLPLLQKFAEYPELSSMRFTKLLVNANDDFALCWKGILHKLICSLKPTAIIDYMLEHLKVHQFFDFVLDLKSLFTDFAGKSTEELPVILRPQLRQWMQEILPFQPAMMRLEHALGDYSPAVGVILVGSEGLWAEYLVTILEGLTNANEQPAELLMQKAIGKLSKEGNNAAVIAGFICELLGVTPEGLVACEHIWHSKHGADITPRVEKLPLSKRSGLTDWKPELAKENIVPDPVVEIMIAGWLQDDDMLDTDKAAMTALASLLKLETYFFGIPKEKLAEATNYFEDQEAKMIEEAQRLESLTKALRAKDPFGTKILLESLGIDDVDPLDEELEELPIAIAGAVEKCGDNEVEISFPLSEWTDLQRSAMGVGDAKTLLLRLFLDHLGDMPTSFCFHLDANTQEIDLVMEHTPWTCLHNVKAPEHVYCSGKATALTWQMSRILYDYIECSGARIEGLHGFVKLAMNDLAYSCPVCGAAHNARNTQLRRPTPCSLVSCTRIWNKVPLDIRIPEFRTDTYAIDMLLTTVYAAAMSARPELLPGCPITNLVTIQAILNSLPTLKSLQHVPHLSASLRTYHKDAEKLLVWALTHFRGYITTATGTCKVPGMPLGTHQFILANAAPSLESAFSGRLPKSLPKTTILFHGTSLDRLPAILTQGLRIHSGTSLQRTGAAHGKGIYMANEPATSISYASSAVSWRNSGLNGMRLLLGCEVAGVGRSVSPGIHVLQDEKSVMVRYVFLLTSGTYAPSASHIVPAMGSAISALRSGTI